MCKKTLFKTVCKDDVMPSVL